MDWKQKLWYKGKLTRGIKALFYIWVEYHILQTKNQVFLAQNTKHSCSKADKF